MALRLGQSSSAALMALAAGLVPGTAFATSMCDQLGDLAKAIMSSRQSGVPMQEVMRIANKGKDDELARAVREMIVAAYEKPRFSSESNRDGAKVDFQNEVYLACIKR